MESPRTSSRNSSVGLHSWKLCDPRPDNELRRTLTGRIQISETGANSRSTEALHSMNSTAVPRYGVQEDQENTFCNAVNEDKMGQRTQHKPEDILISRRILSKILGISIILENKGSVARDHLANERTFLAWTRTAVNFLVLAVGFMQFYRVQWMMEPANNYTDPKVTVSSSFLTELQKIGKPVSFISMVLGLLTTLFSVFRYYRVQVHLMKGTYPATRLLLLIILAMNGAVVIMLLVLNSNISK